MLNRQGAKTPRKNYTGLTGFNKIYMIVIDLRSGDAKAARRNPSRIGDRELLVPGG